MEEDSNEQHEPAEMSAEETIKMLFIRLKAELSESQDDLFCFFVKASRFKESGQLPGVSTVYFL